MPASTTHRTLTKHPRWFENQTRNRPPDRVNSNSKSASESSPKKLKISGVKTLPTNVQWRTFLNIDGVGWQKFRKIKDLQSQAF